MRKSVKARFEALEALEIAFTGHLGEEVEEPDELLWPEEAIGAWPEDF